MEFCRDFRDFCCERDISRGILVFYVPKVRPAGSELLVDLADIHAIERFRRIDTIGIFVSFGNIVLT